MTREERLVRTLVELADTLVNDYEVGEFLHMLTVRATELLNADAAGVLLENAEGDLEVAAASTGRVQTLELFQLQNEEGPCREAYDTGVQVVELDLERAEQRWPQFAPRARELGFEAVQAFPMRLRDTSLGAFNLFMDAKGPLSDADIHAAQALADIATVGILQAQAIRDATTLADQLQHALDSRVIIEQAKGVLAERTSRSPDDAFEAIRSYARSHHRRVADVARDLVDATLPSEALDRPPQEGTGAGGR